MSFADAAFVSLARMTAPQHHQAYNEWHHLDHRPENLLLEGVMWGERWVQTPDCRAAALASSDWFDDASATTDAGDRS